MQVGAQVAHLAGQVRRARSTSRSLVRVDVDALEAVLDELIRLTTPESAAAGTFADPDATIPVPASCPGPRLAAAWEGERQAIADDAAPGCRDCGGTGMRDVALERGVTMRLPCWCVADRRRP
ncbi:hypothetical protein ASF35_16460 [Aeromicrobium sp. Leaf291]|nr:hypothetical protein ASF35_16460 [Aeromicrobium sp. Leaf291]